MTPRFATTSPQEKIRRNILPYLTIPLIKVCTQKCVYCGDGAEMTLSERRQFKTEDILDWHRMAREEGITKFRITGGEPLIHTEFRKVVETIANDAGFVLVNTNGTLMEKFPQRWQGLPDNVHFVVNCHGATEEVYDAVSGTKGHYAVARRGIDMLNAAGKLHRLNAVYNRQNAHAMWAIVDYCRSLGVNLKIQDVVSVPWAFNEWDGVYVDSADFEAEIAARASHVRDHVYASSFGTPSKIYTVDGVEITLKSIRNGAQYDLDGVCKECPFFPCHEGIYDVFAFADNSLWACNWTKLASIAKGERRDKLRYMIKLFQRAEYSAVTRPLNGMTGVNQAPTEDQKLVIVAAE